MKKTQKLLALALIGLLSACAQDNPAPSSSDGTESAPSASEGASLDNPSTSEIPASSEDKPSASEAPASSEGKPSSEENPSSDSSSEEPNCFKTLKNLSELKLASSEGEVYMAAKDGSVYIGYTGKEKGDTPWYHEGKDMTLLSDGSLSLIDGLAPLKLTFSSDSQATIYLQNSQNYLWAGTSGTHNNLGLKTEPTSFSFEEAGDGSFHISSPESVYVEYYKSSFCGASSNYKSAAKVYFLAKAHTEIDPPSGDSSDPSLPEVTPSSYWANVDTSLKGNALRASLQAVIQSYKTNSVSYTGCLSLGAKAAACPLGSSQFVPFYHSAPGSGLGGELTAGTGSCNREHAWPNSRGCGKSGPGSDPFIIRPTLSSENSSRGNSFYGDESGTWDPASCGFEGARGEAARVILYAATAYYKTSGSGGNPFELVDKKNDDSSNHTMGRLSTLLRWNRQYQPNAMEKQINNYLHSNGYGRNPFVDDPAFADLIWSDTGVRA